MSNPFFDRPILNSPWVFDEFCDIWEIESDFAAKVASQFDKMIAVAIK